MFEVFRFSPEEWKVLSIIAGCALIALRLQTVLRIQSFSLVKASLVVSFVLTWFVL